MLSEEPFGSLLSAADYLKQQSDKQTSQTLPSNNEMLS